MTYRDRDSKGKYSKGPKVTFFIIMIVAVAIFINSKTEKPEPIDVTTVPQVVEVKDSKLEEVMNEADFKKKMELEAKKIVFERERKAEIERHETKMAEIEKELEAIRGEELIFTKAASQQK